MRYPIGIQSFESIREDEYVYVDKTALIYQLTQSGKFFFLSRPRRFGKSLLLSTLEAYFLGRKELFKGLAIEQLEQNWTEYPVLRLDLNTGKYNEKSEVDLLLKSHLREWEKKFGSNEDENSISTRLKGIIQRAYEKTGKQVVILIDEYDKPILQTLDNEELQDEYRSSLRAFYSVLKTSDQYIKFAFLTGVTKFSKLSVFSDLNNLKDISLDERFSTICGITEAEIDTYFEESIEKLAQKLKLSVEDTRRRLKEQYDGYHFEHNTTGVYNPFSLLNALDSCKISSYWFETGTPTFLVTLLKNNDYNLSSLQNEQITADLLGNLDSIKDNPIPVIYQSGYLTIKDFDPEFEMYTLGFPNKEVERGFIKFLAPLYIKMVNNNPTPFVIKFINLVRQGNPEEFMQLLKTFLDNGNYRIQGNKELYFQNTMYIIFKMIEDYTEAERATTTGRIDMVVKTQDYIYVMELKLDGKVDEALKQIEENGYVLPFANDPRKLYRIGVNFSSRTRNVKEWKIVEK